MSWRAVQLQTYLADENAFLAGRYACAYTDTINWADKEYASGLVEMTDHYFDMYDANSAYPRGSVSGHEFSHIYGEENHPQQCNSSTDCNIMEGSSVNQAYRRFWWTTSSECEIEARFYNDAGC